MLKVVDISAFQAEVDFHALKHGGVDGVLIKATEGLTWVNSFFHDHFRRAVAAGLLVGSYHFAHPDSHHADDEARHYCNTIGKQIGKLGPALDMEHGSAHPSYTPWSRAFNHVVKARVGHFPLFYSYGDYIAHMAPDRPIGRGLWLAAYGPNDGREHPVAVPHPWKRILGHQYTSNGTVKGIPGHVDISNFHNGVILEPLG